MQARAVRQSTFSPANVRRDAKAANQTSHLLNTESDITMSYRFYFAALAASVGMMASLGTTAQAGGTGGKTKVVPKVGVVKAQSLKATPSPVLQSITLTRTQLENIVKGMVDDARKGTKLYWGHLHGRPVEISRKSATSLAVDLDLAYSVNNWFDPEVDIDFDVQLYIQSGQLQTRIANFKVNVNSSWYSDILSLGISTRIDSRIRNGVRAAFQQRLPAGPGGIQCERVQVLANGDVQIWFRK